MSLFLKKKIPKYFKFLPNDPYAKEYFKNQLNETFIVRPSNRDRKTSVSITYKDEEGEVHQLKVRKTSDNIWNTLWENEEGETEDINEKYLEDIVDKIMIQNDYSY